VSDPRKSPEWQRIVVDMGAQVRTAESVGIRWADVGWPWEYQCFRDRLLPGDRRQLEGDILASADAPPRRHGPDPDELAPAIDVRAERDRRMVDGRPYGYDALARHFGCSQSTIRRRLGTL
jgi:hypothetical protein